MYIELLTTVTAVQQDLAMAYTSSDRMREIGLYFLAINETTVEFFKYVEHPKKMKEVHEAFLEWQNLGIQALKEELEQTEPVESELTRRHVEASQRFSAALAVFATPGETETTE